MTLLQNLSQVPWTKPRTGVHPLPGPFATMKKGTSSLRSEVNKNTSTGPIDFTVLNLGLNKPKSCPEDFMGAVRFLRVCRSPLKWLEV